MSENLALKIRSHGKIFLAVTANALIDIACRPIQKILAGILNFLADIANVR